MHFTFMCSSFLIFRVVLDDEQRLFGRLTYSLATCSEAFFKAVFDTRAARGINSRFSQPMKNNLGRCLDGEFVAGFSTVSVVFLISRKL